ncbi:MAG: ABC transporter permease [Salinivirgaceae bacterium]|jgi:putative ABC transport system permease protein|nr:ABC transporter permease [Salinivirgaceae bacterium]
MNTSQLRNIIKKVFRGLMNNKLFTSINLLGLIIGMGVCMLLANYISFELSYDKFVSDYQNVYRLTGEYSDANGDKSEWAMIPPAYGPAMKGALPEIENATRVIRSSGFTVGNKTNIFTCDYVIFADSTFFDVLTYPLQKGDSKIALNNPSGVILSSELAKKLYGNDDPMQKEISLFDKRGEIKGVVTGVLDSKKNPGHLNFEAIIAYPVLVKQRGEQLNSSWFFSRVFTYFRLKNGTDIQTLRNKLPGFIEKFVPESQDYYNIKLNPLKSIHLHSNMQWDTKNGDSKIVYWLTIIGMVVLIMAWINFINLSKAIQAKRMKSEKLDAILGAGKRHRFLHMYFESLFQNVFALIVAAIVIFVAHPYIETFVGNNIFHQPNTFRIFLISAVGLLIVNTFFTALLPQIIAPWGKTNKSIIQNKNKVPSNMNYQAVLTVLQYGIAIVLIAGTLIIYKQFQYIDNKDLGFDINNKLILNAPVQYASQTDNYEHDIQSFKEDLNKISGINGVTGSYTIPGNESTWTEIKRDINGKMTTIGANVNKIDYDFIPEYKLKILAGRSFSKDYVTDKKSVILNEKAALLLGFSNPNEAIGKDITEGESTKRIIGIVGNHHQESLKRDCNPFIYSFEEFGNYNYTVDVDKNIFTSTKPQIAELWSSRFPNNPFECVFLDEYYQVQYKEDLLFGKVFGAFCIVSILIACLGIFAMSVASTDKRIKEIGVRKVNGAETFEILSLLNRNYLSWLLIAFLPAIPCSYYIMQKWLESFAYKTEMSWWVFALAGIIAIGIALVTVSWQTYRAARRNPIEALRYE